MSDEKKNLSAQEKEPAPESVGGDEVAYLAVPRAQILSRENAISDLYVRLPSGKMVKVARKGDKIDITRMQRLGEKSVDVMYVNEVDYYSVVTDLLKEVKESSQKAGSTPDKIVEQYFQVAESVLTEVMKLPITEEAIAHANQISQEVAVKMLEADDLSKGLRVVFTLGDNLARHCMGTVLLANWLARQLGWTSPRVLHPLTMGALLHDIGLKEMPPELLNKKRLDMTQEEVELFETHATRGMMILKPFTGIPAEVLQIVQQHHELPNGQGFPSRLRGDRMFPLARVVSFANVLAHDVIDTLIEKKEFSIERLNERLDTLYKGMYGSELTKAAKTLFGQKIGKGAQKNAA